MTIMLKANSYHQFYKVKWETLVRLIIKDRVWWESLEILTMSIITIVRRNPDSKIFLLKVTFESLWTIWMWTRIFQAPWSKRRIIQDWRRGSCLSQLSNVKTKREKEHSILRRIHLWIRKQALILALLHRSVSNATHSQST